MKRVVILTGNELRHRYVRLRLANDPRFEVVLAVCEGAEKSLEARLRADPAATALERLHATARHRAEEDFFGEIVAHLPESAPLLVVAKGEVNSPKVVDRVIAAQPDLLVCFGSSLIRSPLTARFVGRFLNVHLGLSPWYRGSGTNVWPLIEGRPDMVGATFMHLDDGIDTGPILHQLRAELALGDSPHSIGNRLIRQMTTTYSDLIAVSERLHVPDQPKAEGRLFRNADFDADACRRLYARFAQGMIEAALADDGASWPPLVRNPAIDGTGTPR